MVSRSDLKLCLHREHRFPRGERALPPLPMTAGLALAPAAQAWLSVGDLLALGLTQREAMKQAARNGEGDLARKAVTDGAGLYTWDTPHAGLVVLSGPRLARLLGLQGMPVVMFPTPTVALLAARDDDAALDAMLVVAEVTYDDARDPCALQAISWEGPAAAPQPWAPPEGHPLRARFLAAAGRTRCDVLRDIHATCASGEGPLAPLRVAPDGTVAAEWRPGASVVLPEVERVVLCASDDEALEVALPELLAVMPHVVERLEWPTGQVFYRTRPGAFPSLRRRAFLARRNRAMDDREVPAHDLLAAWDEGDPVLVEAEPMEDGWLRLTHPDQRIAFVPRDRFGARAAALEEVDQAALQVSMHTVAAFGFRA